MKITAGLIVTYHGNRLGLLRVEFERAAGADWTATLISGHTLSRIPHTPAVTVTAQQYDEIFSDCYDEVANAKRALALFKTVIVD